MAGTITAADGIPPVILRARKFFGQSANEPDRMEIEFSENIFTSFTGRTPDDLFYIWTDNDPNANQSNSPAKRRQLLAKAAEAGESCPDVFGNSKFRNDSLLKTIANPAVSTSGMATVVFSLGSGDNKLDLSTRHFINVRTEINGINDTSYIRDRDNARNVQGVYCNRMVPITYGNAPSMIARPIPNPSSPDPNFVRPGVLEPFHNSDAIRHVRDGGGGSVVRIPVYIPRADQGRVGCQIKVYDLVGNLVHSARTGDIIRSGDAANFDGQRGEYMDIDLYWNGYNSKKMKVAPGTYRLIVQFDYSDPDLRNEFKDKSKFTVSVGVSK